MTKEEAEEVIRAAAEAGNVTFAPITDILEYTDEVEDILEHVFNISEAFVSDESSMSDFYTDGTPDWRKIMLDTWNVEIADKRASVLDAAKALRRKRSN